MVLLGFLLFVSVGISGLLGFGSKFGIYETKRDHRELITVPSLGS